MRETCKMSHTALERVIDGMQSLLADFSSAILVCIFFMYGLMKHFVFQVSQVKDVRFSITEQHSCTNRELLFQEQMSREAHPDTRLLHLHVIQQIHKKAFSPSLLFSSVKSKYMLDKVLIEKFNMVMPQKIVVGTNLVWVRKRKNHGMPDLIEREEYAYTVPFLPNLKNLLCNDEVRSCVDNPRLKEKKIYRTVLDGSFYQNNDFFQRNKNALAIILYYDDLEVVNPFDANTTKHKLAIFYWTLANIYPEVRSTLKTVNLLSVAKYSVLKKYGVGKILEPFIADIKILQNEGVTINVRGVEKVYKGSLLFVAGDTPASALIGVFKESVSAYRFCRTCMTTQNEWRNSFLSENFVLREKESHQEHVRAVTEPYLNKRARAFWSRRYGVTNRSVLMDIPEFDVAKCEPQHGMHVLTEGVVEVHCRAFLRHCIVERKIFTIDALNSKIKNFNFGHLQRDAPAPLLEGHLNNGLRQSASQIIVLAHTLPFLIHEWIAQYENNNDKVDYVNVDDEIQDLEGIESRMHCFVRLLQIINVCFSYEISDECADLLGRMIEVHHAQFNRLYPEYITPKFHFLIHAVYYIKEFGPLRQQMCYRFEAQHAYFKSLVPVVRNFKNIPLTLAYRNQALHCSRLATFPGAPSKKYLYEGDKVSPGTTVLLRNLPNAPIFYNYVLENERLTCQMMRTSELKIHGTTYRPKCTILLECNDENLPQFGEIKEIFVHGNSKLLLFSVFRTDAYDYSLNAYHVVNHVPSLYVLEINEIIFPHSLLSFSIMDKKYIVLLNHSRTEFYG